MSGNRGKVRNIYIYTFLLISFVDLKLLLKVFFFFFNQMLGKDVLTAG